jgi:5'-deoxynucleotidase YfbR-like HD superfamily hydrolase
MALLHDAPEYVIGDMISPFKSVVGGGYKTVEKRLEAAIHLRFGLPPHPSRELKDRIKKADTIAAYFEASELAGFSAHGSPEVFRPAARHHQGHADDRSLARDRGAAAVLRALRRDRREPGRT